MLGDCRVVCVLIYRPFLCSPYRDDAGTDPDSGHRTPHLTAQATIAAAIQRQPSVMTAATAAGGTNAGKGPLTRIHTSYSHGL